MTGFNSYLNKMVEVSKLVSDEVAEEMGLDPELVKDVIKRYRKKLIVPMGEIMKPVFDQSRQRMEDMQRGGDTPESKKDI